MDTPSRTTRDLAAAATVTFLGVPSGIAYAMIAGLPPAMGLYAAAIPVIVGSLFRSSNHVITGPSNALSLLVGTAVAAHADLDPVSTALLLALMVGAIQIAAGALRLGSVVNYISTPVVVGYIAGAGILIGVGQLPNLTHTASGHGNLLDKLTTWTAGLGAADALSIAVGLGTAAGIVLLRRVDRRLPGAILVLALATLASWWFDFGVRGLRRVVDLAPVPSGLPPFTIPDLDGWTTLVPVAIAVTVLSLVESSVVARAISGRTGQRLDMSREFVGQGLSNVSAAFFGGYPTSGSPSRSELNVQSGAQTRLAGIASGVLILGVLLFLGPVVDYTPIAALAGLLLVIAADLINIGRIRAVLLGRRSDSAAFVATLVGTWVLPLDKAIYVGVGISLFLFLRRSRLLRVSAIIVDGNARPKEVPLSHTGSFGCSAIRLLHIDGQLFFAAAGELQDAFDRVIADASVRVVIVRLRRAQGLDVTTLNVFIDSARRLVAQERTLMIVGVRSPELGLMRRSELTAVIGEDNIKTGDEEWFADVDDALREAHAIVGDHDPECPLSAYLSQRSATALQHSEPAPAVNTPKSRPEEPGTPRGFDDER